MKKNILAGVMALALSFAVATPAFAGTINSNEKTLLDKFGAVVDAQVGRTITQQKATIFKSAAENALLDDTIDFDEAACKDLSAKVDEVEKYINENISTPDQARAKYSEIAGMINKTSEKYYITVLLNPADKNGEVQINGKTIGSTKGIVNQTGAGVAQAAIVAGVATATLGGAFFVARKNQLFA